MGEIYRVAVQRVVRLIDENGRETDREYVSVVEFEAAPESLLRFAPAEVAAALGAPGAAVTVYPEPQRVPETLVPTPHPLAEVVERAFPAQADASADAGASKRTRRTKAQKAADDAAQAEGYRDAAHKAEVLAMAERDRERDQTEVTGDGDADLAAAALAAQQAESASAVQGGPMPQVAVVTDPNVPNGMAVMVPAEAASPLPADVPAGSEPPAAPWNPFKP
jgi:hypothetical protein